MKSIQKYRALIIIVIVFIIFNSLVMSDSGWVDENNNIYSHTNGNVGIGTSDPNAKLHINSSIYPSSNIQLTNTTSGTTHTDGFHMRSSGFNGEINLMEAGCMYFRTDSTDRMTIDEYGHVGIGTTTPEGVVHITKTWDVTLATGGMIILGSMTDSNIGIDGNEIMARNNGAKSVLHLNADGGDVKIRNNQGSDRVVFLDNGRVGIGTSTPDYKLEVDGKIHAEEIIVSAVSADFVFEDDYALSSLSDVEEFIKQEGHLPEIPCALEVEEKGMSLGEMNTKLLQKIEELTLYIIQQEKRITELEDKVLGRE